MFISGTERPTDELLTLSSALDQTFSLLQSMCFGITSLMSGDVLEEHDHVSILSL